MAGLTLRDVFLKGGDLFPGTISPPEIPDDEPDADGAREDEESFADNAGDDEDMNCGKTGHGGCGHCEACADYGDMKYHEKVDRELEKEGLP